MRCSFFTQTLTASDSTVRIKKYPFILALLIAFAVVITLYVLDKHRVSHCYSQHKGWVYGGALTPFTLTLLYSLRKALCRRNREIIQPPLRIEQTISEIASIPTPIKSEETIETISPPPPSSSLDIKGYLQLKDWEESFIDMIKDFILQTPCRNEPVTERELDDLIDEVDQYRRMIDNGEIAGQRRIVLQLLIERGDLNRITHFLKTLTHHEQKELFLYEDESGETILYACFYSKRSPEISKLLLEFGAIIGGSLQNKMYILQDQLSSSLFLELFQSIKNELTFEDFRVLLTGADHTLLHRAVTLRVEEKIFAQLFRNGISINLDYQGRSYLHLAAKDEKMAHRIPALISMMSSDSYIIEYILNQKDTMGNTVLSYAINTEVDFHVSIVDELLKLGAKIDPSTCKGRNDFTPLHYAALIRAPLEEYQKLLANKTKEEITQLVNAQDKHGYTALHYILSRNGPMNVVQFLLSSGASVSIQSKNGYTCLHSAVAGLNYASFSIILASIQDDVERKKILGLQDQQGRTILTYMVTTKRCLHLIPTLMQYGADPDDLKNANVCPLLSAISTHAPEEELKNLLEKLPVAEKLELLNQQEPLYGYTLLHIALICNVGPEIIKLLISHGASYKQDNKGNTPLFYIDYHGIKAVDLYDAFLLDLDRSTTIHILNLQNNENETLLFQLIKSKAPASLIIDLLKDGSRVDLVSKEGLYPIHHAILHPASVRICKALLAKVDKELRKKILLTKPIPSLPEQSIKLSFLPLFEGAAHFQNIEMCTLFLETLDQNERTEVVNITLGGATPLHRILLGTANKPTHAMVELLVKSGAKVDYAREEAIDEQNRLCTPLHYAANNRDITIEIWKVLLGNFTEQTQIKFLNMQNAEGSTLLHWLSFSNYTDPEIIKFVLSRGASPNIQDREGNTPLHVASQRSRHLIELFLQYGADPTLCNHDHQQALANPKQALDEIKQIKTHWNNFSYILDNSKKIVECHFSNNPIAKHEGTFCVLKASYDFHENGFTIYPDPINFHLEHILTVSQIYKATHLTTVSNMEEVICSLEKMEDGTISRLMIIGHGGRNYGPHFPSTLQLGKGSYLTVENETWLVLLKKKLNPKKSLVVFYSCGFGMEKARGVIGVCHKISMIQGATVIASSKDFLGHNAKYLPGNTFDTRFLDDDNKTDLTVIYQNGARFSIEEAVAL